MTEVTTPLAAAPKETDAETSAPVVGLHSISLRELIAVHFEWWQEQRRDQVHASTRRAYDAAVADFERRHGEIVGAYWCAHVENAVVLTRQPRSAPWGRRSIRSIGRATGRRTTRPRSPSSSTAATSWLCGPARC